MYLDDIAARIRAHIPIDKLPEGDGESLLRLYAVLLQVKGKDVTKSDVHDVWSAWIAESSPQHQSLVPYADLSNSVQDEDQIFVEAIRAASIELGQIDFSQSQFYKTLFPFGPPASDTDKTQTFELYKIMVQSSESLVNRRQAVNTFFLTINGAILTAIGLVVKNSVDDPMLGGIGVFILSVTGALLCAAWRSLITSFGQLNRGKFKVINTIERHFSASIYTAEWEALERGEDPKVYSSFTSREIWVPNALLVLHTIVSIAAIAVSWLRTL